MKENRSYSELLQLGIFLKKEKFFFEIYNKLKVQN